MNDILVFEEVARKARKVIVEEHARGRSTGMCGIASAYIYKELKKLGYSPKICYAYHGHAFVLCGTQIIDVTADQFNRAGSNFSPMVIMHKDLAHYEAGFWHIDRIYDGLVSFAKFQKEWERPQRFLEVKHVMRKKI